jgi:hypothetical protein
VTGIVATVRWQLVCDFCVRFFPSPKNRHLRDTWCISRWKIYRSTEKSYKRCVVQFIELKIIFKCDVQFFGISWLIESPSDRSTATYAALEQCQGQLPRYWKQPQAVCDISGFHGGEYEDGCLLGCCTLWTGRSLPTFQRCLLPPSSRLSVNVCQTTKRNNPEENHFHLKSYVYHSWNSYIAFFITITVCFHYPLLIIFRLEFYKLQLFCLFCNLDTLLSTDI